MKKYYLSNDKVQFPRLIAEADMCGAFTDKVLEDMAESMSLEVDLVRELINRAVESFDEIKASI